MPRKKKDTAIETSLAVESSPAADAGLSTAVVEQPRPAWIDGPTPEAPMPAEQPKPWADPYKATFTSAAKQFELGENRRFKQMVFTFAKNPGPDILNALKDAGFQYRAHEKAWTLPATAATRELATRLANEWADEGRSR